MRKITVLGLLAGILSFPALAQNKIEFKEFDLDNGLHVIMHQDNTTPIVVTSVLYHVGAKNEQPDRTGFAHFFEHLMFEGSENIERGEYMNIIQAHGGTLNAYTSNDITYYYESLPSNELELALYMESERMLHSKVDETGVETQREVVKEEKRQSYDNRPYGSILIETLKRAYSEHPYRWAPIGSLEHLNAASIEEFQQFYKDFYVPNNATLTIAGDIDYQQAEEWVRKYFSEIPKGTKEIYRPDVTEPKKTEEIRDVIYDNIQIPAVIQAYNLPPKTHPDSYAMSMLSTYLTGGNSSLMTKELVDKQQKALAIAAIPLELEDGGIFIMYGITNMGIEPQDLETEIDKLIKQVQAEGISDRDFEKLQNIIENDIVSSNSSMAGVAENLAEAHVIYGDANYVNKVMDAYSQVKKEDLQRVANEYLDLNGRVVLYYLPKTEQAAQ
ncbi:pitrilysin family protein [Algoriphagus halophytocola]|uniref:Insulinase family protein n=1 Tax=Algoriphagus halophytocola TaxID=2991499 RepID=A0ABY6MEI4_9BACT|nr:MULTISPECIES: pitrilysin family protein [unclassified Algoriphagus]UZD22200.1 insulinase family protein [Algoriphagus sp. TR-M5]WBL43450.1 pitrilysin family protein [Algoriphagus sp. TR-M9]